MPGRRLLALSFSDREPAPYQLEFDRPFVQ